MLLKDHLFCCVALIYRLNLLCAINHTKINNTGFVLVLVHLRAKQAPVITELCSMCSSRRVSCSVRRLELLCLDDICVGKVASVRVSFSKPWNTCWWEILPSCSMLHVGGGGRLVPNPVELQESPDSRGRGHTVVSRSSSLRLGPWSLSLRVQV